MTKFGKRFLEAIQTKLNFGRIDDADDDIYDAEIDLSSQNDPSYLARQASFEYPHHAVSSKRASGLKLR